MRARNVSTVDTTNKPEQRTNTTGHVWDEDLAEYNNPMPRLEVGDGAGQRLIEYAGAGSVQTCRVRLR